MNEYKSTIIELALANGKKAKRIKKLEEDYKKLVEEYNDMHLDLAKARGYAQGLKNDLQDLSKEFNNWRTEKNSKSEWDKHQDVKNGCTGPK
jgi:predicted  nucleic acid-binding Zn-ribbon protein